MYSFYYGQTESLVGFSNGKTGRMKVPFCADCKFLASRLLPPTIPCLPLWG